MNQKFLKLAGAATALSVGTYVALTLIKPHHPEEVKVADVIPAEQVFAGTLNTSGDTATPAAAATEPAPAPAATTEAASAPAAEAPVSAPAEAATAAAEQPAPSAAAEPASEAAVVQAAAPAQATPEPAPEPAAAPAPKPRKPAPARRAPSHATAGTVKQTAGSSGLKAWWPEEKPDQLSLVYAGPAAFKKAVVLIFNGAFFKTDSATENLKVLDSKGQAVAGEWELGPNNRRMLVFPVSTGGKYTVVVGAGLADNSGRKLANRLSGGVLVP